MDVAISKSLPQLIVKSLDIPGKFVLLLEIISGSIDDVIFERLNILSKSVCVLLLHRSIFRGPYLIFLLIKKCHLSSLPFLNLLLVFYFSYHFFEVRVFISHLVQDGKLVRHRVLSLGQNLTSELIQLIVIRVRIPGVSAQSLLLIYVVNVYVV
jgi:hypothetical protein